MNIKDKNKPYYIIGIISGVLTVLSCIISIALSVSDSYVSIYALVIGLILLGINHFVYQMWVYKGNIFINALTAVFFIFIAVLLGLTKYDIYFLITSMFLYSLTIVANRVVAILKDPSKQTIIYNSLCIVFYFLFSFVYFFPQIHGQNATSVTNSNFIVMCFAISIIASSGKNLLFSFRQTHKTSVFDKIFKKSLVYEIILSLLILIILCSIYFATAEPNIKSYVDALWYSFSVVTTIGLGDIYVVTTFGRILSVILGISGIVVVALITSIIVNLYNEMNNKKEEKELKNIIDKVNKLKEKDKDENK